MVFPKKILISDYRGLNVSFLRLLAFSLIRLAGIHTRRNSHKSHKFRRSHRSHRTLRSPRILQQAYSHKSNASYDEEISSITITLFLFLLATTLQATSARTF